MLSGDTNPIRDIGHARWRDFYSKLEDQSSKEFKAAIKHEQSTWKSTIEPVKEQAKEWTSAFESVYKHGLPHLPEYAQESYTWCGAQVHIQHALSHTINVWIGDETYMGIKSFGTDPHSKHYYVIRDEGDGGEDLVIHIFKYNGGKHSKLMRIPHVGEYAFFGASPNNGLYYQLTENRLRTPHVMYTDLDDTHPHTSLYYEYDPRFQVELVQHTYDDTIFVKRYNALSQQLGKIVGNTVEWFTPAAEYSGYLVPISSKYYASNSGIHVLDKTAAFISFPPHNFLVDAFEYKSKIYVSSISACVMNIWVLVPKTYKWTQITHYTSPTTVVFHNSPGSHPRFALHTPNKPTQIYELNTGSDSVHKLILTFPEILELPYFIHGDVKSMDKSVRVPYWYVSHVKNPHALIVSAYGAYGITAHAGYPLRWLSYLQKGFALVVAAPRGGRDNGDDWYNAGRTALRKHTTFDDTAAVIAEVQRRFDFKPAKTIMYGRSAGGWLAAYIGLKYSQLVAAVYTEVPYLDVLRTTTNPALPLTQLEYDEFGDPIRRPEEYKALKAISPNNIVRRAPAHAPFFLVRTALHDAQVLPYEALKFGKHLRKNGWQHVIGLDMDGGHFTKPSSSAMIQGEDAALLERVVGPDAASGAAAPAPPMATARFSRTRRARVHWSKGTTRRRRSIS
jgi:protease II